MPTLRAMRVITLIGVAALCLLVAAPTQAGHLRPKGATQLRLSLVPAYSECAAPNRTHGPSLAFPSCSPPTPASAEATVGTPDANGGAANFASHLRLKVVNGGVGLPQDDPDVLVDMPLSDIRCVSTSASCGSPNASGPADYDGEVRLAWTFRSSDHFNAVAPGGGTDVATVSDHSIGRAISCTGTASTSTGSACSLSTSMNAMIPGAVKSGKRTVSGVDDVRVEDGGADGDGDTTADNTVFLRPGVFLP